MTFWINRPARPLPGRGANGVRRESGTDDGRAQGRTGTTWPLAALAALAAVAAVAAVARAFDLMTVPPTRFVFEGSGHDGLPDQLLGMDQLRRLLLLPGLPAAGRDSVWRELVLRSRRPAPRGQEWTVISAGMALPGLTAAAARLCRGWRGETADIDAEVLAGFVARLKTVDISARTALTDRPVGWGSEAPCLPAVNPCDHPDFVLERAVAAGVLDRIEARLIGITRLEGVPSAQAAVQLHLDLALATDWRWRAELRLRDAVRAGEVSEVALTASFRRGDTAQRLHELYVASELPPALLTDLLGLSDTTLAGPTWAGCIGDRLGHP